MAVSFQQPNKSSIIFKAPADEFWEGDIDLKLKKKHMALTRIFLKYNEGAQAAEIVKVLAKVPFNERFSPLGRFRSQLIKESSPSKAESSPPTNPIESKTSYSLSAWLNSFITNEEKQKEIKEMEDFSNELKLLGSDSVINSLTSLPSFRDYIKVMPKFFEEWMKFAEEESDKFLKGIKLLTKKDVEDLEDDEDFTDGITLEPLVTPVIFTPFENTGKAAYNLETAQKILAQPNPTDPMTRDPIKGYEVAHHVLMQKFYLKSEYYRELGEILTKNPEGFEVILEDLKNVKTENGSVINLSEKFTKEDVANICLTAIKILELTERSLGKKCMKDHFSALGNHEMPTPEGIYLGWMKRELRTIDKVKNKTKEVKQLRKLISERANDSDIKKKFEEIFWSNLESHFHTLEEYVRYMAKKYHLFVDETMARTFSDFMKLPKQKSLNEIIPFAGLKQIDILSSK